MSRTTMNKIFCQLFQALTFVGLTGCGLKGPLYFPPTKQPQQAEQQTKRDVSETGQQESDPQRAPAPFEPSSD